MKSTTRTCFALATIVCMSAFLSAIGSANKLSAVSYPPASFKLSDVTVTYGWPSAHGSTMVTICGATGNVALSWGAGRDSIAHDVVSVLPDSTLMTLLRAFYSNNFFLYPDTIICGGKMLVDLDRSRTVVTGFITGSSSEYQLSLRISNFEKTVLVRYVLPDNIPQDLLALRIRLEEIQRPRRGH